MRKRRVIAWDVYMEAYEEAKKTGEDVGELLLTQEEAFGEAPPPIIDHNWGVGTEQENEPTNQELIKFIEMEILKLQQDKDPGVGKNAEAINKSIDEQIIKYQSLRAMVIKHMEENNE